MSISKDIKIIANTDEIQRKLDKLSIQKQVTEKTDIEGFRATSYQTGESSKGTGAGGNGVPADGVDGAGATVAPEPAKPAAPSNQNNISNTSYNDTGLSGSSNYGYGSNFNNSTIFDQSSSAYSAPLGGSAVKTLVQEGAGDSTLSDLMTSIGNLSGYTSAQKQLMKDQARRKYLKDTYGIEDGVYTARDIVDNSYYVPRIGDGKKINAIIGFDKDSTVGSDGDVLGVEVRLGKHDATADYINKYPTPDDDDATAGQQNAWDGPAEPNNVLGFTAGKYWVISGSPDLYLGYPLDFTVVSAALVQKNYAASGQTGSIGTVFGPNGSSNYYKLVSIEEFSSTRWDLTLVQTDSGGTPIASPFVAFNINRNNCTGGETGDAGAICALTELPEPYWPKTGMYVLSYIGGLFFGSDFDSEVPLVFKQGVALVEMLAGDGVNVLDTNKLQVEVSADGGTILVTRDSDDNFIEATKVDHTGLPVEFTTIEGDVDAWRPR